MALSGSLSTNSYDGRYLKLSWTATQSVANNRSTVSWTLSAAGGNSSWYSTGPVTCVINGTTVYSSSSRVNMYKGTISSGTININHNNDGTKSFSASVRAAVYYNSVNCTGSATFTLNKIARTPSAPTSLSITAGNGNQVGIGETITVTWSGASGVITGYDLQYSRGDSGWVTSKTITSSSGSGSTTVSFSSTDIGTNGAGNACQYRIRAKNGSLASGWKYSNTLYISGVMDIKISGAWKTGSTWIKINGTWKRAVRVWVKVNGSWKQTK